jgi:hypothetical protein
MSEYYYLLSSLPMLREGEVPPLSSADFLIRCADWLTPEKQAALTALELVPPPVRPDVPSDPTIAAWHDWETDFRNRIALARESAAERDLAADQRPVGPCFPGSERAVQEAFVAADPRERERLLDRARWRHLEDLEIVWSFGFDRLCIYKLKLLLAEPWLSREATAGRQVVDELVGTLYRQESATADADAA